MRHEKDGGVILENRNEAFIVSRAFARTVGQNSISQTMDRAIELSRATNEDLPLKCSADDVAVIKEGFHQIVDDTKTPELKYSSAFNFLLKLYT